MNSFEDLSKFNGEDNTPNNIKPEFIALMELEKETSHSFRQGFFSFVGKVRELKIIIN